MIVYNGRQDPSFHTVCLKVPTKEWGSWSAAVEYVFEDMTVLDPFPLPPLSLSPNMDQLSGQIPRVGKIESCGQAGPTAHVANIILIFISSKISGGWDKEFQEGSTPLTTDLSQVFRTVQSAEKLVFGKSVCKRHVGV